MCKKIEVEVYNVDGKYITTFKSCAQAARSLHLSQKAVWSNVKGLSTYTAGKYQFFAKGESPFKK